MAKTIVITETSSQVDWALENKAGLIIPSTVESQIRLLEKGVDPSYYLKFNPNKILSKKYIKIAEEFANNWFHGLEKEIEINGVNFGQFCRMHWLFFLPELLRSNHVISSIIAELKPEKIIIFNNSPDLTLVDDHRTLDSFVAKYLYNTMTCRVVKVSLKNVNKKSASASVANLRRYFDFFVHDPINIISAVEVFISDKLRRRKADNITKADLFLHTQQHIFIDSLPLIERAKAEGLKLIIVADSLLLIHKIQLLKRGINYVSYESITAPNKADNNIVKLSNFWKSFETSVEYRNLLIKYTLNSLKPVISLQFRALLNDFSIDVLHSLSVAGKSLEISQPKVILLSGNSGRRGLAFAVKARQLGITTYLLQHGYDITPIQSSNIFDYMIVWGAYWKTWYSKHMKLPLGKFLVAGWFYIDNLYNQIVEYKKMKRVKKANPTVLFVLSDYMIDNYKLPLIVFKVIKEIIETGRYQIIIRPHPGQETFLGLEKCFNTKDRELIRWDLGKNIDTQLQSCDLVITLGTTVGLRAMLWQKPLIHLKIMNVVDTIKFTDKGISAIEIYDIKKLIATIDKLLSDGQILKTMITHQENFMVSHAGNAHGEACRKIVTSLLKSTKYKK